MVTLGRGLFAPPMESRPTDSYRNRKLVTGLVGIHHFHFTDLHI